MKLTRDTLKKIIKEELNSLLKEGVSRMYSMDYLNGVHKGLLDQAIQQLNQAKQKGQDYAKVNISGIEFIIKGGEPGAAVQYVGPNPSVPFVEGPKVPRYSLEGLDDRGDKFLAQLSAGIQGFYQDQAASQNKQIQRIY